MERLLFLDLDDCLIESSKLIQSSVDENTVFKSGELQYLEQVVASCRYIKEYNEKEIARAVNNHEKPSLIGMASIGSNDITKTASGENAKIDALEREKNRLERWYMKPIELMKNALSRATRDKEMFMEERDNFLETDCANPNGVIDYNSIYQEEHLTHGVREVVLNALHSGEYAGVYGLSHHNGGREEEAKKRLFAKVFPGVEFYGLRFHLDKHEQGVRRPRSSKALRAMELFNLSSLENCILIDDSTANLDEWARHGGIAILYRPMSADEECLGRLESHGREYQRITSYSEDAIREALDKTAKQLRK